MRRQCWKTSFHKPEHGQLCAPLQVLTSHWNAPITATFEIPNSSESTQPIFDEPHNPEILVHIFHHNEDIVLKLYYTLENRGELLKECWGKAILSESLQHFLIVHLEDNSDPAEDPLEDHAKC